MTNSKLLDYRKFLKDELHLRKMKNSKYSLRAYARDLGISTSRLSEIFAGKSGLSYEKAAQISDILNFSEKDRHLFLDLVESDHARSSMARRMAKARVSERLTKFQELDHKAMNIVGNWRCFAIYEFLLIEPGGDVHSIAKALGESVESVSAALTALIEQGSIKEQEGKYARTGEPFASTSNIPSDTIKKFHSDLLEKVGRSLHKDHVDKRDVSSMFFCCREEDLPLIKERIIDFRRAISLEFENKTDMNATYCIGNYLIPVAVKPRRS